MALASYWLSNLTELSRYLHILYEICNPLLQWVVYCCNVSCTAPWAPHVYSHERFGVLEMHLLLSFSVSFPQVLICLAWVAVARIFSHFNSRFPSPPQLPPCPPPPPPPTPPALNFLFPLFLFHHYFLRFFLFYFLFFYLFFLTLASSAVCLPDCL